MQNWEVIYQYEPLSGSKKVKPFHKHLAMGLIALSLGGMVGPLTPAIRLETGYWRQRIIASVRQSKTDATTRPLPASVPVIFNPLVTEDGASIDPINKE